MISVEPALFSNVINTVQRTGSLPGGSITGLPGGVVITGLQGVGSFAADIADAQNEFKLGRVRTALERVKLAEMHFNGIAGRWNSTVQTIISSAKQGRNKLSLQKLNEVKGAQTKMRQLSGPASKSFQDLVSALEHAVSMDGRTTAKEESKKAEAASSRDPESPVPQDAQGTQKTTTQPISEAEDDMPDAGLLGSFLANYRFGQKLQLRKGKDNKSRVVPQLEQDRFYFMRGLEPPRVIRIREIQRDGIVAFDSAAGSEFRIEAFKIKILIRRGIWVLDAKQSST